MDIGVAEGYRDERREDGKAPRGGVTRDVDVSDSVKTDLCADAIVRCRPVDTLQLQERSQTRRAVNAGGVVGVGCWSTRATGTVVLESKIFLRIFEELRLTLLEDL